MRTMELNSVPWATFHLERSALTVDAPLNMRTNVFTELVSQSSALLKALAFWNVSPIFVTELVSQTSALLKASADLKVYLISVTALVSQTSSELKALAS